MRPTKTRRVLQPVLVPAEGEPLLPKEAVHDLELLCESRDAVPRGEEVEAVRLVLALHPTRADAEGHATAGDLVGRRGVACEDGRMPERRRRDERAELERRRARREAGNRRPGVEDGPILVRSRNVVVGAKERLDAACLARVGERDPVAPRDPFLTFDHQRQAHRRRP